MSKSKLIGILFDVSGSMKEPYKNMSKNISLHKIIFYFNNNTCIFNKFNI